MLLQAILHKTIFTLADKVYITVAGVISGVAGYGFSNEWGVAILAASIGLIGSGLPRVIVALTGSRKSYSDIVTNELRVLSQLLKDERDTVRLVRITKHNYQTELHSTGLHIDYLEETLKEHNIDHGKIKRRIDEELCEFETQGMKILAENQLRRAQNESN